MTLKKIVNGEEVDMSPEEEAAIQAEWQSNAQAIPSSVSMAQARLVLLAAGKLAAVQTAIDALPSPDKDKAQIWWDYSSRVEREHPYVLVLAPLLGLDTNALDTLFIQAQAIS
jgi:hypothetical protein